MLDSKSLLIDVGNSSVVCGWLGCDGSFVFHKYFHNGELTLEQFSSIKSTVSKYKFDSLALASVFPPVSDSLVAQLPFSGNSLFLFDCSSISFSVPYEGVGVDRLLFAYYAQKNAPGCSVALIDAGTVLTVDLLKEGSVFVGGYLMPGLGSLVSVFEQHASMLPPVSQEPLFGIGDSTERCMSAGVTACVVGGVQEALRNFKMATSGELLVYVTGGDSLYVAKCLDRIGVSVDLVDENLLLFGLASFSCEKKLAK